MKLGVVAVGTCDHGFKGVAVLARVGSGGRRDRHTSAHALDGRQARWVGTGLCIGVRVGPSRDTS